MTTPADIDSQFLAGDTIEYSCNGDLIPDAATTLTCIDNGPTEAVWDRDVVANPLPMCSK